MNIIYNFYFKEYKHAGTVTNEIGTYVARLGDKQLTNNIFYCTSNLSLMLHKFFDAGFHVIKVEQTPQHASI